MSLRLRVTVLVAVAVALAIVGASLVVYYTDRHELMGQVDNELEESRPLVLRPGPLQVPQRPGLKLLGERGSRHVRIAIGPRLVYVRGALAVVDVAVEKPRPGAALPTVQRFSTRTAPSGARVRVLTYAAQGRIVRISR